MTTITNPTQVTGLEVYWQKVKLCKDQSLRTRFLEALDNPAKNTLYANLKNPGRMKASQAIKVAQLLTEVFQKSITPEDLLKSF